MEKVFRTQNLTVDEVQAWTDLIKARKCPISVRIEPACEEIPYSEWTDEQKERAHRLYFGEGYSVPGRIVRVDDDRVTFVPDDEDELLAALEGTI